MAKIQPRSEKYKIATLTSLFLLLLFYFVDGTGFSPNIGFLNSYILIILFFITIFFAYCWSKSNLPKSQTVIKKPEDLIKTYWYKLKIMTTLTLPGLLSMMSLAKSARSGDSGTEYMALYYLPFWLLSFFATPFAIYYSLLIILKSKAHAQKYIAVSIIIIIILMATYIFAPDFYKNILPDGGYTNYGSSNQDSFRGYILGIIGALTLLAFTIFAPRLGFIKKKKKMFQIIALILIIGVFFYLYFKLSNRQPEYYRY